MPNHILWANKRITTLYNLINLTHSVSLNHVFIFKIPIKCPSLFALRMH